MGFAISLDQSLVVVVVVVVAGVGGVVVVVVVALVVAFLSSTVFFTASAADAVACVLLATTSRISLISSFVPEQYCPSGTMYGVQSAAHHSLSPVQQLGFQRPQAYGSKRSRITVT